VTRGGGWAVAPDLDAIAMSFRKLRREFVVTKSGVNVIPIVRRRVVI
jgi:hypothetical protein